MEGVSTSVSMRANAGIAYENGSTVGGTGGNRMVIAKFRRNRHFSTKLASHGFVRDTSLQKAQQVERRRQTQLRHVSDGMNDVISNFYTAVGDIVTIQRQLIAMQRHMAQLAIEMLSVRRIQHMVRGWVARHTLWKLRVARFIRDRVRFRMYYRRRVRAAIKLSMRVLIFLARRLVKIRMRRKAAARRIQKLYLKYRLYHRTRFRCVVLGKVGRLLKHFELFGKCRAIMFMRREEVKRVQREEQAQYAHILEHERQQATEAAELAAARAAEAIRLEAEMKETARLRLEQALKKQQQKASAVGKATAALKGRGKETKEIPTPVVLAKTTQHAAPTGRTQSQEQGVAAGVASLRTQAVPEKPIGVTMQADSSAVVTPKEDTPIVSAAATSEPAVAQRTLDPTAVLLAHSLGITAGQASVRAMHQFIENRYGSVYGGFYGEYCCPTDNRENSFAAVRFRFMLRCFRKKRLKALAGPQAKSFFYTLSHLHNSTTERHPNLVVLWLQAAVRQHATQKAGATGRASGVGGKTLGKLLLSSLRSTKLLVTEQTPTESAAGAPSGSGKSTTIVTASHSASTEEEADSTFLTSLITQSNVPFRGSGKTPMPNNTTSNPSSPTKPRSSVVAPAFPTYTSANFPTCFITASYRPRTFAELVIILCDMRRAVLKIPSLVDDSEPPAKVAASKTTGAAKGALLSAMLKGKRNKEPKDAAHKEAASHSAVTPTATSPTGQHVAATAVARAAQSSTATQVTAAPMPSTTSGKKAASHDSTTTSDVVTGGGAAPAPAAQLKSSVTPHSVAAGAEATPTAGGTRTMMPTVATVAATSLYSEGARNDRLHSDPREGSGAGQPAGPGSSQSKAAQTVAMLVPRAPAPPPATKISDSGHDGASASVAAAPDQPSGHSSVPALLRAHSRTLRPSQDHEGYAPSVSVPAPTALAPSTNSTGAMGGTTLNSVRRPSRGMAKSEGAGHPSSVAESEGRHVMPIVQSVPTSAIIAAARETVRQAERSEVADGVSDTGTARPKPIRKLH